MADAVDLSGASSNPKMSSKVLRQKAQEFLASRKHANNLVDIIGQWDESPSSCLLTIETIFVEVLRRGDMYLERTITLTISEPSPEARYINWLRNCYEEIWEKILLSIEKCRPAIQLQALTTAIKLMAEEGRHPLEPTEYEMSEDKNLLCRSQQDTRTFVWDQAGSRRALNKVWVCVMHWELTPQLHKQLLVVLLERVMPHLEKPVLLTDFLMDSLDADGPIALLALQGVFLLVTKHNLEYPNIFTKLYSMFEPEIFHTKYKARLFYLSDLFLSSTHLPEALVAAFAKRLARLTLVAPPEDILIILHFVGNLLLRHPGLKRLIDHPQGGEITTEESNGAGDPFLMEERDPLLSNALFSSLWEIKALQWHVIPSIASAARFIREPLPSVEYDMGSALERTGGHLFDRELKNKVKDIMLTFERPNSMTLPKGERLLQYWQLTAMH
ncbi:nucleolar complex protein 4 homolog B isoform X2 [Nomia melanderi]|uniref:nucleolar complex protein 4 homolog B isoform X2 n=1 Tax=Nomia melanderi TaxID=2448451 RepID=UPI001304365A|nr:nucleolar complex protein 4 homolog B isoform X2 [Nomia melanderi]